MAIHFFSINGAGSGGGGSSVVTANGIGGTGTAGDPIILGGTSLNQDTTLDFSGFSLHIAAQDAGIATSQQFIPGTVSAGVLDASDNTDSGIAVSASGGGIAGTVITTTEGATGHQKKVIVDVGDSTGIQIQDAVDAVGLIGNALFANSDPNQYAQYGNVAGGADNGLTLNAGVVQLGGTLNQYTTIQQGIFDLQFFTDNGTSNTEFDILGAGLIRLLANSDTSTEQAKFSVENVAPGNATAEMTIKDSTGTTKFINSSLSSQGIFINDDINHVGLIGDALFPAINPNQYAQYGNIPGLSATNKKTAQTTSIVTPILIPAVNNLVRVNIAALFTTFFATSVITVNVLYTDINGNAANAPVGIVNSAVASNFNAIVIAATPGSNIDLSVTYSGAGGSIYNIYANAEILAAL